MPYEYEITANRTQAYSPRSIVAGAASRLYQTKGKIPDPAFARSVVLFNHGYWQWLMVPPGAHAATCPACHRIHDHFPARYFSSHGNFFYQHRAELLHLINSVEKNERQLIR